MPLSRAQLKTLANMCISQLERAVLATEEETTCSFLRVPMPPSMAVDKPANERFVLRIRVAIINSSARRGRKRLLCLAIAVTGTPGHLRQDGRELQPEAIEEPVVDDEMYDYVTEGALYISDAQYDGTRTSISPQESWRETWNRNSLHARVNTHRSHNDCWAAMYQQPIGEQPRLSVFMADRYRIQCNASGFPFEARLEP
ncbi:hypothetical protein IW262DRAFT_1454209 [Armillaria fumosa]|nr:hypothetical protein IW262DRAFT_1454209 [Armillaria fumosa]